MAEPTNNPFPEMCLRFRLLFRISERGAIATPRHAWPDDIDGARTPSPDPAATPAPLTLTLSLPNA